MARLNKQIEAGYVQMNDVYVTNTGYQTESQYGPLELKDQFNLLADELSEYINITVTETTTGSFTVETGAKLLDEKDKYARVDVKFAPDKEDIIEDAAGNPLTLTPVYLEFKPAYDKDGNEPPMNAAGFIEAGTKLYNKKGEETGLVADGNGGYLTEDGKQANVYVVGESVFKDKDGNIIENWGTINDGSVVYDENDNKITVRGNFDAETIVYDFAELYISSANTDKGWTRALRELTTELQDAGLGDMIVDLNSLI